MSSLRRPSVIASFLIGVALVGALAAYLYGTQAAARDEIIDGFGERATLAARLTSGALNSNLVTTREYARTTFGGPARGIQAAIDADVKSDPQPRLVVLGPDGQILGAFPKTPAPSRSRRNAI